MDAIHLASRCALRAAAYWAIGRRRDALCAWCDMLLTTGPVPSLPLRSLQPQQQRRGGGLYVALAPGQIATLAVEHLLSPRPLAEGEAIAAVDARGWRRVYASARTALARASHA